MKNPIKHLTLTAIALVTSLVLLSVNWADIAANSNLVQNGGFEEPEITSNKGWNIFTSAQVPGWTVEWRDGEPCQSGEIGLGTGGMLELQNDDVNLGGPNSGEQYAEFDSDCNGPDNNNRQNEAAAVRIYQDLTTEAGATYEISFYLRKRPNTGDSSNKLTVKWDGSDVVTDLGAPNDWTKFDYTVTASGSTTRLELVDAGVTDSLGTFVDDVKVVPILPPHGSVNNILDCVIDNGDGTYTAFFGYENHNGEPVVVPFGPDNAMTSGNPINPPTLEAATPTQFGYPQIIPGRPGRSDFWPNSPFQVVFDGNPLTWNLYGSVETASSNPAQRCKYHISIEKVWLDKNGEPIDGLPQNLAQGPNGFQIVATSSQGTVTCHYENDVLTCDNNNDLPVPSGEMYDVTEVNIPSGWMEYEGVGQGFGIPGYAECDGTKFCTHIVKNREKEKPTAISLASFEVEANDGRAMILWETGTEIDNAGFNLYRAPTPNGPWVQVNSRLIAAEGDPVSGAQYNFVDTPGRGIFYYQLEDIDYYGVTTLHDPVEAQLGATVRVPWFRPAIPNFD